MNWCADARELDRQGKVVEAIAAYEMGVAEGLCTLDDLVNLAVLYLEAADPGFSTYHHLPADLIRESFERAMSTLDRAEEMFGPHPTVEFWRRYIRFVVLGEEPPRARLEELAAVSLLPSFYLSGQPGGEHHRVNAMELLEDIRGDTTAAARYIRSVAGHLAKASRNRPVEGAEEKGA